MPAPLSTALTCHTRGVRIPIHVHPGSRQPGVGGSHGGALIVRVAERATDGRATAAALAAVAAAFGVKARAVSLIAGATSRDKVLDVEGATPERLAEILAASGDGRPRD